MIVLTSPSCVFISVLNYMNTNSPDAGYSLAVVAVVALCLPFSSHSVLKQGLRNGKEEVGKVDGK